MSEYRFHPLHGANVALSSDGLTARRLRGYGRGLVFSSLPVKINQRVGVKVVTLPSRLSSALCFGFTSVDPARLGDDLQSSYRDLLRDGFWMWPLFKAMCAEGTALTYYVTAEREVHFEVDGREVDSFYRKVNTRVPLWAILDIDGESTTVQLALSPETDPPEITAYLDEEEEKEETEKDDLCTVCCRKQINSVLYKCGHMCMCFECAMKQKQGPGNGQCPFCRADIKDVIRTYK